MKSILAISLGLSILGGHAAAQSMSGSAAARTSVYVPNYAAAPYQSPPSLYSPPASQAYSGGYAAPRPPSAPKPPTMAQPSPFKPYKPKSVYSTRGGLDPYPKPAKPKGYLDLR